MNEFVIDIGHYQNFKDKQQVCGDTFLSKKIKAEDRTITVLSDGLGSGIKANVLSTLTASMAYNYIANLRDIKLSAESILNTLPVCSKRKISYATFSIADIDYQGFVRFVEYDTPDFILIKNNEVCEVEKKLLKGTLQTQRKYEIKYSEFQIKPGDRLILFSDGVSQAGTGSKNYPLGWGWDKNNIESYILEIINKQPDISGSNLAKSIVSKANSFDGYLAKDDTSCAIIYYRKPRNLLLMTGPPMKTEKDKELSKIFKQFSGKKIICGGTTAKIIARELKEKIEININSFSNNVPPGASMKGADMVTEGIMTLSKVNDMLEQNQTRNFEEKNPATELILKLMDSDIINIVMGTKINEAHQDPNIPQELGIRRNIVKRMSGILEDKYLKKVNLKFI